MPGKISHDRLLVDILTNRLISFDVLRSTSTRLPTRWTLSGSAGLTQDWMSSASLRRGTKTLMMFHFVVCVLLVYSCWSVLVPFGQDRRSTTSTIRITAEWRWLLNAPFEPVTFEHLIARVTVAGSSFVFAVVYRPGSATVTAAFFDEFRVLLEHLSSFSMPYVITGDLINICFDRPDDPSTLRATELLEAFGAVQCVAGVTQDRGGTLD